MRTFSKSRKTFGQAPPLADNPARRQCIVTLFALDTPSGSETFQLGRRQTSRGAIATLQLPYPTCPLGD